MKKLQNPTTFFFRQAEHLQDPYRAQIEAFSSKLLDKDNCLLCKMQFNTSENIPRIMIHCGHTFCTACLANFYMNRRVRCPMCLKLVKQLDSLERLPINHTVFENVVRKMAKKAEKDGKEPEIKDASKFLFGEFQRVQKQAHRLENPQKIDEDSGLFFCVFHPDRVEHFFCAAHNSAGCRVCIEIGHNHSDCEVIDLYTVQNPQKYTNAMEVRVEQPDMSQPFIEFNGETGKNAMLGLNNQDQDEEDQFSDVSSEDRNSI